MSATYELRRLLDERGVELRVGDYPTTCTVWESDGIVWHGLWRDGCIELIAWQVTPAQAIDATLGRGTCEVEESWSGESEMVEYRCTACDEYMAVEVVKPDGTQPPNYCPNCGARVVEP